MPKVTRKDIDMSLTDVILVTAPDGSKIAVRWSEDLKGFEVALQGAAGGVMCPYLAVFPSATNTLTLVPSHRP